MQAAVRLLSCETPGTIRRRLAAAAACALGAVLPAWPRPAVVTNVTVRTRAANNPAPKVWYRAPEDDRSERRRNA